MSIELWGVVFVIVGITGWIAGCVWLDYQEKKEEE